MNAVGELPFIVLHGHVKPLQICEGCGRHFHYAKAAFSDKDPVLCPTCQRRRYLVERRICELCSRSGGAPDKTIIDHLRKIGIPEECTKNTIIRMHDDGRLTYSN